MFIPNHHFGLDAQFARARYPSTNYSECTCITVTPLLYQIYEGVFLRHFAVGFEMIFDVETVEADLIFFAQLISKKPMAYVDACPGRGIN